MRVVMITGASAGIGYETALTYARRGDHVIATARRLDRLEQLAAAAQGLPGQVLPFAADVVNPEQLQAAVAAGVKQFGHLDVLLANAGLGHRGPLIEASWADLDMVIRTNIDGVLHSVRAAVPAMTNGGHIIMMSSILSLAVGPYSTIYSASKTAVNAIARGLRIELAPQKIWVTTVLLGQAHSEFAQVRRGSPGKVASKLPTMSAEYVAQRLVKVTGKRRRTLTLRWLDRGIMMAGVYFPWIMDRVLARFYK